MESSKLPKFAKEYVATTYNDQLTAKVERAALKNKLAYNIILEIVKTSFKRGHKLEVAQIHKVTSETKAYLIATTSEQKQKLLPH